MYLHLGQNTIVPYNSIIGIFDLDITSQSKITRNFLASEENAKRVVNVSEELPRSVIVCSEPKKSTATLQKRVAAELIDNKAESTYGGQ